jgi:hypothetical protein
MVTYTTTYNFAKPTVGDDEDVWGGYLNGNFDTLESLLKGTTSLTSLSLTGNITVGGTVDGRDVATDGTKLDGIESGATADQTASEILTAIKTVDGSGSGLDADTLDGQEGSYYLNTSTTFGGDVSGTYDAIVVANDSHTHTFDNLTAKDAGTGDYATTGDIQSGKGSGGVALTINDGGGNANVTFNHKDRLPEQSGQSGRIEVNTDNTTAGNAIMTLELGGATSGVTSNLTEILKLTETSVEAKKPLDVTGDITASGAITSGGNTVWHAGNDGFGSGLDADTLDGYQASESSVGSTVVVREADGDINFRYGIGSFMNMTHASTTRSSDTVFYSSTDNFIRKNNATGFKTSLGLSSTDSPTFSGLTITGDNYITMQEGHYVNRRFEVDPASAASAVYIILCRNAANNDVNGTITMDRTSGLRFACSWDIIVSSGSSTTPIGSLTGHSLAGAGQPSARLVTLTYSSVSYVALELTNPDNYYETTGAYFNGRIVNSGSNTFTVVTAGQVSAISSMYISTSRTIMSNNLEVGNSIIVPNQIIHDGDDDTNIAFTTDTITLNAGGSAEVTIDTTGVRLGDTGNGYFQPVSGSYGSVQIDGGAHGGWEGYSIGGRAVFMHNNATSMGLYDDVNNHWALNHTFNGTTQLYYDGSSKLQTTSTGANIDGNLNAVDNIYVASNIYHEGDTDTYVGFAGDQVDISTGGTQARFNVNGLFMFDGNVHEDYDALSGTTPTINAFSGGAFSLTMTGNTTFTFSSVSSGFGTGFVLQLTGNATTAYTVTWPTSVDWAGGTAPDAPAVGETDIYVFWTRDGGTTWYGVQSIDAAA